MTQKAQTSSCLVREYDGFEGIDRSKSSGGLSDIVNFRLTDNKSLTKREAAVWQKKIGYVLRAYYVYDDDNLLILTSNSVSILNLSTLSQKSLGLVNSALGDAQFLCYDGKIILLDGNEFYVCSESGVSLLDGYAPLYGRDWDPQNMGHIDQPLNLLSRHFRISYKISADNPSWFNLNVAIESVDGAYVDGSRVNEMKFTINDGALSISCGLPIQAGSTLTLFLTAKYAPIDSSKLKSSTRAAIFGDGSRRGADSASIAFYRGSNPSVIYTTQRIEKEDFDEASLEYGWAHNIYVTASDAITVGNGTSPITATCRRGGKLLVFTPEAAFIMTESENTAKLLNLSSAGGCTSKDGAASMGDSPVTVSDRGILKWSPVKYDSEEYIAECISIPIGGLTGNAFRSSSVVYHHRRRSEIWFTDPSPESCRIFIYNYLLNAWYSFGGIAADSFFEAGEKFGFFSRNNLYLFNKNEREDTFPDGKVEIASSIVTGRITFGGFDFKKRLFKIALRTGANDTYAIKICDASSNTFDVSAADRSGEQLGYIDKHVSAPRSRYYTVTITASSSTTEQLCGLTLTAAK